MRVPIDNIHLDPKNPRLPEEFQDKSQKELLGILYRYFALRELAESMARNGYFAEEPLVVVPTDDPQAQYVVVEGNRRLATAKILLSQKLRNEFETREWPELSESVADDLSQLPVTVYPKREDVISHLGVRHITGVRKWGSYAKARYIAGMTKQGYTLDDIQQKIGDRSSIRKSYACYRLVEQMGKESEGSAGKAKNLFSYLLLAAGQRPVKEYIGLPERWSQVDAEFSIPSGKLENLRYLFSFLFGEGKERPPVIKESRDITNKLAGVLRNKEAIEDLIDTRNLEDAYERSGGEEKLALKRLKSANRGLEAVLGIIHRQKEEQQVIQEAKKCKDTLDQILKVLKVLED